MTREIKFRAWDKQDKKMYDLGWLADMLFTTQFEEDYGSDLTQYEIMQFTGLKDKNGVEIYEGDICKYYDSEPDDQEDFDRPRYDYGDEYEGSWHDVELVGKVEWGKETSGFTVGGTKWWSKKNEVIGNIYENPDLVKELV